MDRSDGISFKYIDVLIPLHNTGRQNAAQVLGQLDGLCPVGIGVVEFQNLVGLRHGIVQAKNTVVIDVLGV